MAIRQISAGEVIYQAGQKIQGLDIIVNGIVSVIPDNGSTLSKGEAIGITDIYQETYFHSYVAQTDVALINYPYRGAPYFAAMLQSTKDLPVLLFTSALNQITSTCHSIATFVSDAESLLKYVNKSYSQYKQLCLDASFSPKILPGLDSIEPLITTDIPEKWLITYYEGLLTLPKDLLKTTFAESPAICAGFLLKASKDMNALFGSYTYLADYTTTLTSLLLDEDGLDLLDLYTDLYYRLARASKDTAPVDQCIKALTTQINTQSSFNKELYQTRLNAHEQYLQSIAKATAPANNQADNATAISNLTNSLDTILDYSGCDDEVKIAFRQKVNEYKALSDKASTEDAAITLRKILTKLFHQIYISAFQVSVSDISVPTVVRMFFLFGYVDEELAGLSNAICLYNLASDFTGDASHNVYTFYDWLLAIYQGRKSPSRNEFDTDYDSYVHDLKRSNRIDADIEEQMHKDNSAKVMYELENMFPPVNKMAFGEIINYCPLFSESNLLKPLDSTMVTAESIMDSIQYIRQLDYSAYYRETVFSNEDQGVSKEFIQVEYLPDFILLPTVGSRGVMWQEIEGKKRTTPARMMLPAFCMSDLRGLVIRLTGEYRWEMCKRVQGSRWNDVSEHSLTSDYVDYVQFYRKNTLLSPDAKEKIKSSLIRAKNSYKESFVRDYILWISFESMGAPRLNRVVRSILFAHCPFTQKVCSKLLTNPLYADDIHHHEVQRKKNIHHYELVTQKIQNLRKPIPKEITNQIDFINT